MVRVAVAGARGPTVVLEIVPLAFATGMVFVRVAPAPLPCTSMEIVQAPSVVPTLGGIVPPVMRMVRSLGPRALSAPSG